ncbi:hypothetical protein [Actinoplanes sp. DH11]|uniref:hypothetical protein n=1 Tax=Actinoplanes sp. DH11 TaxID=2857011 RepID=UPI001E633DE9|nr:hypothetical protein [Actinoplanes sp. DH11]
MSRRRIIFSIVVVLLGAAVVVGVERFTGGSSKEDLHARLVGISDRLKASGSARVAFTAELKPQVAGPSGAWSGTSMVTFGETEQWDATYSAIVAGGKEPVEARGIRVGADTWYTSPSLTAEDGRSWFRSTTPADWGAVPADPNLDLTDFGFWKEFLTRTEVDVAAKGYTDELPDVPGAPHEYMIRCTANVSPNCPPPLPAALGGLFNKVNFYPLFNVWIGDDGLIRRLDLSLSLIYEADPANPGEAAFHPQGEYFAAMSFTLDQFGTPVTVTAPGPDEVTRSSLMRRAG